jgi:hypothetical protein
VSKLVSLYPRRWKERYGQEFERVLSDYPKTLGTVCNVIWGALVAHLHERITKRRNDMSTARRILGCTWSSVSPRMSDAALLLAVALAVSGVLVWNMTTTAYFGPPGHFTRTVQHQVYPHRAEALWIMAGLFGALSLAATLSRRRGPTDH